MANFATVQDGIQLYEGQEYFQQWRYIEVLNTYTGGSTVRYCMYTTTWSTYTFDKSVAQELSLGRFTRDSQGNWSNPDGEWLYPPVIPPREGSFKQFETGNELMKDGRMYYSEDEWPFNLPYDSEAYFDTTSGILYMADGSIQDCAFTTDYHYNSEGQIVWGDGAVNNGDGTVTVGNNKYTEDGGKIIREGEWSTEIQYPDTSISRIGKDEKTTSSYYTASNETTLHPDGTITSTDEYFYDPVLGWQHNNGEFNKKTPITASDGAILYPDGSIEKPPVSYPPYESITEAPPLTSSNKVYEDDYIKRYDDGTVINKVTGEGTHVDDRGNPYKTLPDNTWEAIPKQANQPVPRTEPIEHGNGDVTVPNKKGGSSSIGSSGSSSGSTTPSKPTPKPPSEGTGEGETGTGDWAGLIRELKEIKEVTKNTYDVTYGSKTPVEGSLGDYQKKNYGYRNEVEFGEIKLREHKDSEGKVIPIYSGYKRNIVASKVAEKNIEQHKDVLGENQSNMDIADNYEFEQQKIDAKENIENTSVEDVGVPEELDDYKVHRDIGAQFFSIEESQVPDVPLEQ